MQLAQIFNIKTKVDCVCVIVGSQNCVNDYYLIISAALISIRTLQNYMS